MESHTNKIYIYFFFIWRCGPTRVMVSSFTRFLDHTQRRATDGGTPLDEWSARRRDLDLTTHNTHNRKTSMPPVGFETTISAGERPQTQALDCSATGIGTNKIYHSKSIISHTLFSNVTLNSLYTADSINSLFKPNKFSDRIILNCI
jgi:hypothetical protein